jgi:hypothetical protein
MKPDVAVDLANSTMIIITCPLPSPVTPRGMGRMAAVITLPCIRVQDRAMPWDSLGDQVSACAPVHEPLCGKALMGIKHVKECRSQQRGWGVVGQEDRAAWEQPGHQPTRRIGYNYLL